MNEGSTGDRAATPWHLWAVGIVSLLWNAVGVTDYSMTMMHNATWLAAASPEQRAYFDAFPLVMLGFWALGVWGAFVGSLLLLVRTRHAVTAFAASLVGLAATTFYQFAIAVPPNGRTMAMIGFNLFIWAVALALFFYARAMRTRGVLR